MSSEITLGYWNLRGLCHSVRLLLKHAGVKYNEVLYDEGKFMDSENSWFKVKPTLGLDFPNLPYLLDGDMKLTQSVAILRYLGRKYNMAPESEAERVKIDVLEMQIIDWRTEGFRLWYQPKEQFEKDKPEYEKKTRTRMVDLAKAFGSGPFILGNKLTHMDFMLYEYLDNQRRFIPGLLNEHKVLNDFVAAIEALPEVKKYLESKEYKDIEFITAHFSNWGNRKIPNHLNV